MNQGNNTANAITKGQKTVGEDSKHRHKESERLRWKRLKEAQQGIIALLPSCLQEKRKPQTLQMLRLVNYIAFMEILLVINENGNLCNEDCRLLKLLFGIEYKQELLLTQSIDRKVNTVQVFNLEKLLFRLRQRINDLLEKDIRQSNLQMTTKSKADLVAKLKFENEVMSGADNRGDHLSVDSFSNEGSCHPEAPYSLNWYFETPISSHQSYPSLTEPLGLSSPCQLFPSHQIDSHVFHIPSI